MDRLRRGMYIVQEECRNSLMTFTLSSLSLTSANAFVKANIEFEAKELK